MVERGCVSSSKIRANANLETSASTSMLLELVLITEKFQIQQPNKSFKQGKLSSRKSPGRSRGKDKPKNPCISSSRVSAREENMFHSCMKLQPQLRRPEDVGNPHQPGKKEDQYESLRARVGNEGNEGIGSREIESGKEGRVQAANLVVTSLQQLAFKLVSHAKIKPKTIGK